MVTNDNHTSTGQHEQHLYQGVEVEVASGPWSRPEKTGTVLPKEDDFSGAQLQLQTAISKSAQGGRLFGPQDCSDRKKLDRILPLPHLYLFLRLTEPIFCTFAFAATSASAPASVLVSAQAGRLSSEF